MRSTHLKVFPPHGAGDVPRASSMSEATHCQDVKIGLHEPVVNLLLILPTHINKYFKSSLFCISLFPYRELPWNLVSSWRSCSFFCPVAPVITTLHSRFESPHNIKSLFVPKISHAIFQEYKAEVWQTPSTEDAWGSTTVPEQVEIHITIDCWPNVVAWLQSRPIYTFSLDVFYSQQGVLGYPVLKNSIQFSHQRSCFAKTKSLIQETICFVLFSICQNLTYMYALSKSSLNILNFYIIIQYHFIANTCIYVFWC